LVGPQQVEPHLLQHLMVCIPDSIRSSNLKYNNCIGHHQARGREETTSDQRLSEQLITPYQLPSPSEPPHPETSICLENMRQQMAVSNQISNALSMLPSLQTVDTSVCSENMQQPSFILSQDSDVTQPVPLYSQTIDMSLCSESMPGPNPSISHQFHGCKLLTQPSALKTCNILYQHCNWDSKICNP